MSDSTSFPFHDSLKKLFSLTPDHAAKQASQAGKAADSSAPAPDSGGPLAEAAAEAARALSHDAPNGAANHPAPANGVAQVNSEASANAQPGGQNAAPPERRRRRRAMISAPVRIRGVDQTRGGPDEISTTVDVSRIGFKFITASTNYHRGMDVMVTFPHSSAANELQAEQLGRVVRIHETGDGKRGVAVSIGPVKNELVDSGGRRLGAPAGGEPLRALSALEAADPEAEKRLILVVDADTLIRMTLKTYLNAEGYDVLAVQTADEAREVLNLRTPDLLLAEIEGEGLPGFDLCAHVKTTPRLRHIPVVLLTQSAYPSDYSNAHSLGAVVCMAKPFKQERLGHVVRLLAPPPHANNSAAPPHKPHPRRHAGGHMPKAKPASSGSRGFRILPG